MLPCQLDLVLHLVSVLGETTLWLAKLQRRHLQQNLLPSQSTCVRKECWLMDVL